MRCIPILVQKNSCWIWIAVNRIQKRFLDCVLGSRSGYTGMSLWSNIKDLAVGKVMTDHWQPYTRFVPGWQHIQSKAETFTVEGYNGLFRHFLARLRRKTKCYSKSAVMLLHSIRLLMCKWNNSLSILF